VGYQNQFPGVFREEEEGKCGQERAAEEEEWEVRGPERVSAVGRAWLGP
jgi:hypothetical protein